MSKALTLENKKLEFNLTLNRFDEQGTLMGTEKKEKTTYRELLIQALKSSPPGGFTDLQAMRDRLEVLNLIQGGNGAIEFKTKQQVSLVWECIRPGKFPWGVLDQSIVDFLEEIEKMK